MQYKIARLTFRVLYGSAPPYLGPLLPVRCSLPGRRSLCSTGTNRLLVSPVKRSTVGSRAFPAVGPKTWNTLPEDVTSSQSEYTFRRQLKTMWLPKKSFPDIIIWYWLHLDFLLRPAVCSNLETVLPFNIYNMIWYDMICIPRRDGRLSCCTVMLVSILR